MKKFVLVCAMLLTSCNVLVRHKDEFKKIGHEVVDEEIDEIASPPETPEIQ